MILPCFTDNPDPPNNVLRSLETTYSKYSKYFDFTHLSAACAFVTYGSFYMTVGVYGIIRAAGKSLT